MSITKKHLSIEQRQIIEDGIGEELSASSIARRIGVTPSTVTREVKKNRKIKLVNKRNKKPALKCKHGDSCCLRGCGCRKCVNSVSNCSECKYRDCTLLCEKFEPRLCKNVEKWPYVCPANCKNRSNCWYPKCSYIAEESNSKYKTRLVSSREGADITKEELKKMMEIVSPLIKNGQSPKVIWANHSKELPVTSRSFYNYVNLGIVDITRLNLTRAVKFKPRNHSKNSRSKTRIDRSGREYEDYLKLDVDEIINTVQADSLIGFQSNSQRIISLHFVRIAFQFYFLAKDGSSLTFVEVLDTIEIYLRSVEAFRKLFWIILADRGEEFDDIQGIERSYFDHSVKRCKLYYCDPSQSYQKGACEKNHVEFRKILPKEHSNFDALNNWDVATICSHVNSYPREKLNWATPLSLAKKIMPRDLLENQGIVEIKPDDVVLKPKLLNKAIV